MVVRGFIERAIVKIRFSKYSDIVNYLVVNKELLNLGHSTDRVCAAFLIQSKWTSEMDVSPCEVFCTNQRATEL